MTLLGPCWQRARPCAKVRGVGAAAGVLALGAALRAHQPCELCCGAVQAVDALVINSSSAVVPLEVFSVTSEALLAPQRRGAAGQEPGQEAATPCTSGPGEMQLIAPLYIVVCQELPFGWAVLQFCSLKLRSLILAVLALGILAVLCGCSLTVML